MKQTTTEQCGHGYFRKSKAYGLVSGIMLASFFLLSTATASATEVTASSAPTTEVVSDTGTIATEIVTNQATNLAEPQPAPTPEHVQAIAAEGQVVGEAIPVPAESSGLNQAVAGAEAVGVEVIEETEPAVKDNLNEATAELDNQEKKVDEAKETQKQTDAIREENTAKAKKAGVIETPTKAVTYTDNNAAALKDAREQEGRVDVVAEAQIQVNAELPAAVLEAVEAGVAVDGVTIEGNKVVFSKVNRYADVKAGLDDLTNRVAAFKTATATQREIDAMLSQAVADMRKSGLIVSETVAPKSVSDVKQILETARNLVTTYADYQKAQENSKQLIADEEIVAKAKGVNILPGKEDQAKSVKELESKSGAIVGRLTEAGEAADYVAKKEAESKNLANANNLVVSEKAAAPTADIKQAKSAADQDLAEVKAAVETKNKANAELDSHAQKTGATTNLTVIKADAAVTLSTDAVDKHVADEKADMDRAAREALAEQERHNEDVKVQDGTNANINAKAQEVDDHELITVVHTGAKKTALADIPAFEREQLKKFTDALAQIERSIQANENATNDNARLESLVAEYNNFISGIKSSDNGQYLDDNAKVTQSVTIGNAETTITSLKQDIEAWTTRLQSDKERVAGEEASRNQLRDAVTRANEELNAYGNNGQITRVSSIDELNAKLAEYKQAGTSTVTTTEMDTETINRRRELIAEFDAKNNQASTSLPDDGSGYTPGDSYTHLKDKRLGDARVVTSGALTEQGIKSGDFTINILGGEQSFITGNNVVSKITWAAGTTPEAVDGGAFYNKTLLNKTEIGLADTLSAGYEMNANGTTSEWGTVATGHWYRLANAVQMADGSRKDLFFKPTVVKPSALITPASQVEMWNQDGAINVINGYNWSDGRIGVDNGARMEYRIGDFNDTTTKYVWPNIISDVDKGQYLEEDESTVIAVGGNMSVANPKDGKNITEDYKGIDDAPLGTIVTIEYANTYGYTVRNKTREEAPGALAVARADFGVSANINIIPSVKVVERTETKVNDVPRFEAVAEVTGIPTRGYTVLTATPTPPPAVEPITVEYSTVAVDSVVKSYEVTYTPVNLQVELNPQQIEVESGKVTLNVDVVTPVVGASVEGIQYTVPTHDVIIATTVKPVVIEQKPTNVKAVYNMEGQDINGKPVAKGSMASWATGGEVLKAGRPQFSALTREDFLAPGQTVDMEKTVASSDKITFTYNAKTHSILQAFKASVLAEANLDQTKAFILPEGRIYTTVLNDGATYENNFTTTFEYADSVIIDKDGKITKTGEVKTYKTTSNKVVITTPTKSQPEKHIYTKDGQQIDGKSVLPNTELYYTAHYDLAKYKGVTATKADIEAGFAFFDDPQDSTVQFHFDRGIWTTAAGKTLDANVFSRLEFENLEAVKDEKLKALIAKSGFKPSGNFGVWLPNDPAKFYADYVSAGNGLFLTFPISTGDYTGTFKNTVHQVVFGNGYAGNIVENNIPKLEAIKDVLKSIGSGESIANGLVALGQEFPYKLDLPAVPKNLAGGLNKVHALDDFDERYDEYNGEYYSFADRDMKRKDGSIVKLGDELTRYWVQNIKRDENGKAIAVEYTIDKAFLDSLADDELFDATIYPIMKRIAYGENIENTLIVFVNDIEVSRSTVKTNTPKPTPPAPEVPVQPGLPSTPTPAPTPAPAPQPSGPRLPETGDASGILMTAAGALTSLMGLIGFGKRKENN